MLIENAIGDYVALFSPQAQSVKDLDSMLKLAPFYDVVIGKRNKKIQGFFSTIFSKLFYKLVSILTHIKIDSSHDDFLVMNKKVLNFLINQNDRIKFVRLIALNSNFNVKEFPYTPIGKSKTRSFLANVNFAIDLIISNSFKLLRIGSIAAILMAFLNLIYIFYIFLIYIFKDFVISGWTSSNLYSCVIYAVLFLILSIVCEYIRIILINQKQNKAYEIIDEKISTALLFDKNIEEI